MSEMNVTPVAEEVQKPERKDLVLTLECSSEVCYYQVHAKLSPIKRLYVKNNTQQDMENITVRVYSQPDFLLPVRVEQAVLPRKMTTKFDCGAALSPLYMVGLDTTTDGEIIAEVLVDGKVVERSSCPVKVAAFQACNYAESPEMIAAFVKRTPFVNELAAKVASRLKEWKLPACHGYVGDRNKVRNYFAAIYSVLSAEGYAPCKPSEEGYEMVQSHADLAQTAVATPLELALLYAALVESNGLNAVILRMGEDWYAGTFLQDECMPLAVNDDCDSLIKKAEKGVYEFSVVSMSDLCAGTAFEKAERAAVAALKKGDAEFAVDIRRARIMHIEPLPERIASKGGYDLQYSKDYMTQSAPSQIRELKGEIGGTKDIDRMTQWERKLLDMDMRNALLNFKVSRTAVQLLVPSIEDLTAAIFANKTYELDPAPKDYTAQADAFARTSYLKPFADYVAYEYKNRKLLSVYDRKAHEATLLRLLRKEQSVLEETGTTTLYLAAGYLRWTDGGEDKFAPLLLYPATLTRKGVAAPVYALEINTDDIRLNSTLLEFLYQQFNKDMRGLGSVKLDSQQNIMSVLARLKKEIVDFKGWEILGTAFLTPLSFANYQLWHDIRYRPEKFKEHPVIRSLIENRLDLGEGAFDLSDRSSDEAYTSENRMYMPISADSSQYSAIYDSLSKSFVLHGPPGTGKSQTITNIIANNIVRGRRVLFVAEKMAALSVVHSRLQSIGLGDFCLELHSGKTNKSTVLAQIVHTLSLADNVQEGSSSEKLAEISDCIERLQGELTAMHKKRSLGISLYDAVLEYFANQDSPDCLRIDSLFYEKLTETSFAEYLNILTELTLRARECGVIDKSPFRHIGGFAYSEEWREQGSAVLDVYLTELKHLREYAHRLMPLFNIRTVALTNVKLKSLYGICKALNEPCARNYFRAVAAGKNVKGILDSYTEACSRVELLMQDYEARYGSYPSEVPLEEAQEAAKTGKYPRAIRRIMPPNADKNDKGAFAECLARLETVRRVMRARGKELQEVFDTDAVGLRACVDTVNTLYDCAKHLYADFRSEVFEDSCYKLTRNGQTPYAEYYITAYESCAKVTQAFCKVYNTGGYVGGTDIASRIDHLTNIRKNFDYIPNWCKYQEMVEKCRRSGLDFVLEPLSDGEITPAEVLSCFKKCVYLNFIRTELMLDDVLCQFSALTLEEIATRFKDLTEEYERLTRTELYNKLVAALPTPETEGEQSLERVILNRAEKSNMKGTTLRGLFGKIPNLLKVCCPCMLMSPTSVTQFLDLDMEKFDLVIFDEASQLPTCRAVGCIVRGKDVIIVGDPQQLPPTTFFNSDFHDDENYDVEDLSSILEDALALGMPQNKLLWHYRSLHESLIAFSNAMYYGNTLLTFPSPNELNSKVGFRYVDGVYDRGGHKYNKKEGDELVEEVIRRLKDPAQRKYSIGIVTFNTAQQAYIENVLTRRIHESGLDEIAFDCAEPVFVKNLENVQGDERDLILFSVGYGPDANGKLSLNFGPLNQAGGYKRLNVAVTRARNEMLVFSAITGNMIDLSRTNSKGVEGFKAFLEYAERGRQMLAVSNTDIVAGGAGIGQLLANDLREKGIVCEYDVGVSDFKIDVAIVDPTDKNRYLLAILADSRNSCKLKGVKDRIAMQTKILRRLGWNTYMLWTVNYFNNPRREVARIKEVVAALTQKKSLSKKALRDILARYRAPYRKLAVKPVAKAGVDYVFDLANEDKIRERIRALIERESPIELRTLTERLQVMYNVPSTAKKALVRLSEILTAFDSMRWEEDGKVFYADKPVETFRPSDEGNKRDLTRICRDEIIAAAKCAAESNVGLTRDNAVKEIIALFGYGKKTRAVTDWIESAIDKALEERQLMLTVDGILTT